MPPRGSEKVRSSISSRSPKPLRRCSVCDDDVAEPRAGRDVDLDLVELDVALLGDQRLVVVQARLLLRLAALRVLAHPVELGGDRLLARLLGALLLREAGLLLLEPARVVALVRDAARAVELEDPAGDVVEEVAIVGDRDDVPLYSARWRSSHATDSASRWFVGSSRSSRSGVASSSRHSATRRRSPPESFVTSASAGGRRSASIAYSTFVSRFHASAASIWAWRRGELVGGLVGVVGGELVEAVEQRARPRDAVLDVAAHVLGLVEVRLLLEQADGRVGREHRVAAEVGVAAGHDVQHRRLAGAVVAEDADLRAGQERERDVLEHRLVGRERLGEAVHLEDVLMGHGCVRG